MKAENLDRKLKVIAKLVFHQIISLIELLFYTDLVSILGSGTASYSAIHTIFEIFYWSEEFYLMVD